MPDVSVIIPAHNAGRTIGAAIASVLGQTVRNLEVIVVDDGSTDDTSIRVAEFGNRIVCLHQPHRGMGTALGVGLAAATGPVVAFLEPTAVWLPRKLERQLRYLERHPAVGLVYGDITPSATPSQTLLGIPDTVPLGESEEPPSPAGPLRPADIALSTVVLRSDMLRAVGIGAGDSLEPRQIWSRMAELCGTGRLATTLAIVRPPAAQAVEHPPAARRARNLLHDTAYRRVRSAATSSVHALDDMIWQRRRGAMRVLFEAASPMSLAVFGPVLRQLSADRRLEFWFTSCDSSWDARALFASAGIRQRVVSPAAVEWAKFDAYINTDFWDMTWLHRRTRRVHFFHGVAGKYGLDAPVRIAPVVATFDRLMFPNRDRLRRYAEAGLVDADSPQAALIGYPKVDCLVDGSLDRHAILDRLGLDPSRPTVLYAPTWSPYSSLNVMGRELIPSLGRLGVNVLVKLHDRSYDTTARGSGGVDWRQRLAAICAAHGAHLVHDPDASPYLFSADLLVTDHSSVGFEFMLLDRPIVVIDSPELVSRARVNPEKVAQLQSAAFVARQQREVASTVRRALDRPTDHSAVRRAIADELFYCPGSATGRAVQCLYDLLGVPAPAVAPAASRATAPTALAPARLASR
jgi:glycosyltransferase involved in cell wall biosynthesis